MGTERRAELATMSSGVHCTVRTKEKSEDPLRDHARYCHCIRSVRSRIAPAKHRVSDVVVFERIT